MDRRHTHTSGMKFLPFNTDLKLNRLRWRYHWRMVGLNLLCIFLSAGAACYYGASLAGWLGVGDGPLRDEPQGLLWVALFFLGFVALVIVAHLFSFVLIAVALRWSYGWSGPRIRGLMFESRIPPHWLKPVNTVRGKTKPR
jgi:hypothetical protein